MISTRHTRCSHQDTGDILTDFCQRTVFLQDLVITEPDTVVCNGECVNVIEEGLALWMMVRCAEGLEIMSSTALQTIQNKFLIEER